MGEISDTEIELYKANDTTLLFIMPDISSGNSVLNVFIDENEYAVSFNILESVQIDDPAVYIDNYFNSFTIPEGEDYDEIRNELDELLDEFNSLNHQDKIQAAQVIAANRAILDEVNTIIDDLLSYSSNKQLSCNQIERTAKVKCLVLNYTIVIAKLATPVVGLSLWGGTVGSPILGVGSAAGAFIGGSVGILIVKKFMKNTLAKSSEIWNNLSYSTFEPYEVMINTNKTTYDNNVEKDIDLIIKYVNIQDKQYSQSWLSNFMFYFGEFRNYWSELMDTSPPDFAELIQDEDFADNFDFLSISVLNNPNVIGVLSGSVENLKVQFTTQEAQNQSFTYRITYNDGEFVKHISTTSELKVEEENLVAEFDYYPQPVLINQAVNFVDNSSGSPTDWSWNFGNGSTSSSQNPSIVYSNKGNYAVRLIVQRGDLRDTLIKTVNVGEIPVANFTGNPTLIGPGGVVNFTDQSTGDITNWNWNFGDVVGNSTSTAQNPSHQYNYYGEYTVSLTVSNEFGSDTKVRNQYILVDTLDKSNPNVRSYNGF